MTSSNNHDIGGYDMLISVTDKQINAQLDLLFKLGKLDKKINQKLADGTSLEADLAAPTFLFKADDLNQANQRIFLVLHLKSGKFIALDHKEIRISGWKVAVKVDFRIGPLSQKEIETHNGIPEDVKHQLQQFDEINFKVNQLYVDFKSSGRAANIERAFSTIPDMTAGEYQSFGTLLQAHLQGFSVADNPYNIGYIPTAKNTAAFKADPERSIFEPTGVSCSITGHTPSPPTLNYLLMTKHKKFPTGDLSGIIKYSLEKESVMRLSQRIFVEDFILARIQKELSMPKFSETFGSTWNASQPWKKGEVKKFTFADVEVFMSFDEMQACKVNFSSGSREGFGKCGIIKASGTLDRKVWFRYPPEMRQPQDLSSTLAWEIELYITVNKDGRLYIKRNDPTGKVVFDEPTDQWFENVSNNGSEGAKQQAAHVRKWLASDVNQFLASLSFHFRAPENILVLPAGNAFFFSDVRFDKGWGGMNLLQTLRYKNF